MIYETVVVENTNRHKYCQAVNRMMNEKAGMIAGAGISRVKGEKALYYCIFIGAEMSEEEKEKYAVQNQKQGYAPTDEWDEFIGEDEKES